MTSLWLLVQGRNLTPNMLAACSVFMAIGALSTSGYDHSMTCSKRQTMSLAAKGVLVIVVKICWSEAEAAGWEPVERQAHRLPPWLQLVLCVPATGTCLSSEPDARSVPSSFQANLFTQPLWPSQHFLRASLRAQVSAAFPLVCRLCRHKQV